MQRGKNFPVELKHHDDRGDIFIGYKKDTIKQIVSGKFLEELIDELSKTIKKSYAKNNDHPAFRSETRENELDKLHSEIVNSLNQLQWKFKHEWPIGRLNKKTGKGELDFIIRKNEKDDYIYAVEVKLCHKGYNEDKPLSERKIKKFVSVVRQIENMYITKFPEFCKGAKTVNEVALLFIVFNSIAEKELNTDFSNLNKARETIKHHMLSIDSGASETQKSYLKHYSFEARWFLTKDIVIGKSHKGKLRGKPKIFPGLCAIAQTEFNIKKV